MSCYPKHRKSSVYADDQKRNSYGLPMVVCSKCHREKRVASRTKRNLPLCPSCHNAQMPKRKCGQCGIMHKRNTIKGGSFLCGKCYFKDRPKVPCGTCGRLHSKNTKSATCVGCYRLHINGFTIEQIQKISQQIQCDFPKCLIQRHGRKLCADHLHDAPCRESHKYQPVACPRCLRGVICYGHNRLLVDLDRYPDEANEDAKEYLNRIGYILTEKGKRDILCNKIKEKHAKKAKTTS